MMKKIPTQQRFSLLHTVGFGLKVVVIAETVALIGSYFMWRKMNRDRDFRYKVYQTTPLMLDYYYKVGEKLGGQSSRREDYAAWGVSS